MYSYMHKCSNKILTRFHQRSYLPFYIPYIYKVVQHANDIFEKNSWPLFSSSIKKENAINECIAQMLMKFLLLWTNVLMTHVIAFQILNKTHMLAHGHEQTPKTTMPNSWIYDYIYNHKMWHNWLHNFIIQSKSLLPWHLQLLHVTIECQFYFISLLIWLILISLFNLNWTIISRESSQPCGHKHICHSQTHRFHLIACSLEVWNLTM